MHGDYYRAEVAFRIILFINPSYRPAHMLLTQLFTEKANMDGAALVLEDWLVRFPADVEARAFLSSVYCNIGNIEKAQEHLDICFETAPDSDSVLNAHGVLLRSSNKLEQSSNVLRAALEKQESPFARYTLAENLIDSGAKLDAINLLDRVIKDRPGFEVAYRMLARSGHYEQLSHPDIGYMLKMLSSHTLRPLVRARLHFTLRETYHKSGRSLPAECFGHVP